MTEVAKGVEADPEVMHGKPVLKDTRVPVEVVLSTLAEGVSMEEVCEEFDLEESQVLDAIHYAADRVSGEEFGSVEA